MVLAFRPPFLAGTVRLTEWAELRPVHDINYTRELLIANEANGYKDLIALVDLSTYRRLEWEEDAPFFLLRLIDPDTRKSVSVDPRSVLDTVTKNTSGWKCMAGAELEVSTAS